jgi:hypothetical protein
MNFSVRAVLIICISLLSLATIDGQVPTQLEGSVSFITASSIYVKFTTTQDIEEGDTLFVLVAEKLTPALLVKQKSSISCVASPIGNVSFEKEQKVFHLTYNQANDKVLEEVIPEPSVPITPLVEEPVSSVGDPDSILQNSTPTFKEKISGRITAASFSTFSKDDPRHRFRHTLAFSARHINNSGLSFELFTNYFHGNGYRLQPGSNLFDQLKLNSLAVSYATQKSWNFVVGRRINPHMSNIGVIDGAQVEWKKDKVVVGVITGSRPDYQTFGFNTDLAEAGVYLALTSLPSQLYRATTLGVIDQRNQWITDRRFVYLQHAQQLTRTINVFFSSEIDLYEKKSEIAKDVVKLTGFYGTIRFRPTNKFNIAASYDQRRNIVFFETFKNQIDQLIDEETRQGLRLNSFYRVTKKIQLSAAANWRFQKSNVNVSKNYNCNLSYNNLPYINGNISASVNLLETGYLNNTMIAGRYNRGFFKNKMNWEIYYRVVNYQYKNFNTKIKQNIIGSSISYIFSRKINLQVYYEGTDDATNNTVTRFNLRASYRL